MAILLFVVLIVYIILYYDLKSDYKKLRQKYEQLKVEKQSTCEVKNNPSIVQESVETVQEKPIEHVIQEIPNKKKKVEEKTTNKLNWLFGIGMALICLTYFALVNTTWDVISNGAKAFLVLLFSGIFFGASVVLEKVLKTVKANFVFWLLGVIYLPFALIAIFAYGLFGNYLSFAGEGSAICLTIVALVSLIINLISSAKYKNPVFVWIYMISELLVITFATNIFTPNKDILLLVLSIYTGIVMLMVEVIKKAENYDYVYVQYNIYKQIVMWVMSAVVVLRAIFLFEAGIPVILTILIMVAINLYESYKSNNVAFGISGLILATLSLTTIYQILFEQTKLIEIQLIVVSFVTCMLILALVFRKHSEHVLHKALCYFGYTFVLVSALACIGTTAQEGILPIYVVGINIIGIICAGILGKQIGFGFALPILILIETLCIINVSNMTLSNDIENYIILGVMSIIYTCTCFFSKNKYIAPFKWGITILIPIITLFQFVIAQIEAPKELFVFNQSIIYIFVAYLMYGLSYWKLANKEYKNVIKYVICVLAYVMFGVILKHFAVTTISYAIAGAMMFGMEVLTRWKSGKSILPISIISNIAMLLGLFAAFANGQTYMLWFYILTLVYYVYNSILYRGIEGLTIVFKLAYYVMIYIVTSTIFEILYKIGLAHAFNIEILVTTIIITILLLIQKKQDLTTMIVLILLNIATSMELANIDNTVAKSLIIELLPTVSFMGFMALQSIYLNSKAKDVYKAVIAIIALAPYNIIFNHFDLVPAGINALVYVLDLYIITRLLWKKYWKNPKKLEIVESIALVIIYLTTMIQSFDGFNQCIVLDLVLAGIIIFGFIKQENTMFITTAISFIVIVFAQTTTVEFPIIWLVVLLLFGIGFIGFAAYNEVKKRNQIGSDK